MKKLFFIFLSIPLCTHTMYEHTPALYIVNRTKDTITIQVTNPRAQKTISQLVRPGAGTFAYQAQTIEAIMVNARMIPNFDNLSQAAWYQDIIAKSSESHQNLCLDIVSITPLVVSPIQLCAKTKPLNSPFTTRVLVKNNNWLWGKITDIKTLDTNKQSVGTLVPSLVPQQITLLDGISGPEQYTFTATGPSDVVRTFFITQELLQSAQDTNQDVLFELKTDWIGTINIKKEFLLRQKADKLIADSQKPSQLVRLRTAFTHAVARLLRIKHQERSGIYSLKNEALTGF